MGIPIYTVYDIETTGLSAACQCEIIEFAGIQYDADFNEVNRLHIYVKPYKKLPKKIVELTGITNEQLAGCENRFKALPKIRSFIGDTISVCHNASFDFGFISTMCLQQGLPILSSYICTLKTYKALTGEKSAKLFMACEKFGIELKNAHTAIADVEATAKVFKKLLELDKLEPVSKIYKKTYEKRELYESLMANIAAQNPNKKVRDVVCASTKSINSSEIDVDVILSEFNKCKTPIDICDKYNYNINQVNNLFALWLNPKRLPKFIFLEDFTLNRQVQTMIDYAVDLHDLYDLHAKCYPKADINVGLYNYFWIKFRHEDAKIYNSTLNFLFTIGYDVEKIVNEFPHIKPCVIVLAYVQFAESNRETHRANIAKAIISKKELNNLIEADTLHYTDLDVTNNPNLIKNSITCALYERGFFKL